MNYADLTDTQRDALLAIVASEDTGEPTLTAIHHWYENHIGPISRNGLRKHALYRLIDASLARRERSESDGRVRLFRPTDEGRQLLYQALRERRRWIEAPEPRPDHRSQTTLSEVMVP